MLSISLGLYILDLLESTIFFACPLVLCSAGRAYYRKPVSTTDKNLTRSKFPYGRFMTTKVTQL